MFLWTLGPNAPLSTTGRAYFGDYLEGDVTATDFGTYSNASGAVASTLEAPLAVHIQQLNRIRRAVPALQKGQYTRSKTYVDGNMAFIRRYTQRYRQPCLCNYLRRCYIQEPS